MGGYKARCGCSVEAEVDRKKRACDGKAIVKSIWDWECYDKHGSLRWKSIGNTNVCTDQGLNSLLDIMFHGSTQVTTWYVAIFQNNYTPLITNTYAVPGYTECTAYDEATRPAYDEGAASGKSMTNSASKASFTMNATRTIYGGALVSNSTKGDTAAAGAILYCSSLFDSGSQSVESGDVLRVTITLTAADS